MHLASDRAVDVVDGQTVALTDEPWLRLEPIAELNRYRWVCLRYDASYFDDPVRPLILMTTEAGAELPQPMNGPVLGSGSWIGRVPDNTVSASISPVNAAGRFDFRLRSIESVSRLTLLRRGLTHDRDSLMLSLGARIINAQQERWDTLKFAATSTSLGEYDAWYRQHYRRIDVTGLDRPRADWTRTPAVRLVMALQSANAAALAATLASLREQVYARWTLHGVAGGGTPADVLAAFRAEASKDGRLIEAGHDSALSSAGFAADDVVTAIRPGDVIPDHGLAVLVEKLAAAPAIRAFYGDEDSVDAAGTLHSPLFKPDWSPVLFDGMNYLGRPVFIRYGDLARPAPRTLEQLADDFEEVARTVIAALALNTISHVRRILYRRRRERNADAASAVRAPQRTTIIAPPQQPEVAIVIPTRDHAALLSKCVSSLREVTDYPHYKVIVVDNGSTEPDALALLGKLSALPDVEVLRRPGPFNFSALCNDGARAADAAMLVFLNNDTIIVDRSWLAALVKYAVRPNIGVVGAMLWFPNDLIQHAGVVLGHCGIAGHMYVGRPPSEKGYLDHLAVAHEVSAVTGACIAIERKKFDAAGGFDADHLPVDLNDIDLCLKASEKGWASVWTPEAKLYHLHSATRGFLFKPTTLYRHERGYFVGRWPRIIRDDPFFHPALSLYSHRPALGLSGRALRDSRQAWPNRL